MMSLFVGDAQEVKAVYNAYCEGRTQPLPLGALKSNTGHSEGASGISSVIKVLIAFENQCIPPNINLKQLKEELKRYFPPLMIITEKHNYEPGLAAINNFGIGGTNVHVLLEPNTKLGTSDGPTICQNIPRIVNICGRTQDAVNRVMDFIQNNPKRVTNDFLALLAPVMRFSPDINSGGMPYRGVMKGKSARPLWLVFPGLGGQWPAMAKALMTIKIFADKVEECHQILHEFGIDLKNLLLSEDKTAMSTMTAKFCSTTALEIAMFEVMKALDITPDGIIGHSFGETACAYADGCLSTRDAMIAAYFRGTITENDNKIPKGLMAVVGLSRDEALKWCPNGVFIACNNAKNSVVVSGLINEMKALIHTLTKKGVFVRQLESCEIPYHSQYLITSAKPITEAIKKYTQNPKLRSRKWVSTSLMATDPSDEALKYASAEYFVYNLLNPVHFYDRLKDLPSDAIVLELGPHSVFGKIVTETLDNCTYVSLIKKDSNDTNLDTLLTGLATLYESGINISIEKLYARVEWPVARSTQSISSLIQWEHKESINWPLYPHNYNSMNVSDYNFTIDAITHKSHMLYLDHSVDGNPIFPATGYLMLAWRKLAASIGKLWYEVPVIFEHVQFKRAVFLKVSSKTKLTVKYFAATAEFVVLEADDVCVVGKVRNPKDDVLLTPNAILDRQKLMASTQYSLDRKDIYKELGVVGLDYGQHFQRLRRIQTNDFREIYGINEWDGNCVTYLDAMLQSMTFVNPFRILKLPVMIRSVRVDPRVLFAAIRRNHNLVTTESENNNQDTLADLGMYHGQVDHNERDTNIYKEVIGLEKERSTQFEKRFCIFSADMPLYFNAKTNKLVANGLEIEGLQTLPIQRRTDGTDLVLNSYGFYPNHDTTAIDAFERNVFVNYLEQKMIASKESSNLMENVWLVANDSCINGIIGLMNCLRLEPGGEVFRYIFHMDTNTDTNTDTNIDFNTIPYSDILANDLMANVIKGGKVGTYRHSKLPKDYDKCVSDNYYLNWGQTRDLSSLQWADTGQRVMGLEFGRMFCTTANVADNYMTAIPEHWSMAEAVTVLTTYSTVHYGLIKRANLSKGESVLIHSAAGGVGQAAIYVCKHYECDIYATVGTEEKKQFLINEYNIPENRIFSSRDILFKNEIMDATDGQGVDVVLNSLTGEKLSAGLECLAFSGRFVEIGKYDMIYNKQLAMNDFIRNIQFIGVSVDGIIINDIHYLDEFYNWMHKNCTNGCVKPLNYTVFEAKDADKAFRYMTSGEHIGKVIVKMREEEKERTALTFIKPVPKLLVSVKTYFNPNKVYIITGGLGGFGLELIPWMQSLGARKFVVTSRSSLKTDYQKFIYNRFQYISNEKKYFDCQWLISTANGLTIEGTKQLLNEAKELAPIGGVFHLALELNDSLFENITIEKFCSSIDTKHKIFANLDQMTRQLHYKLDYFVVFSSAVCGKGHNGQSNYGFGNSLCERICEERRRDGLHGLAVQYGPIADVGVLEDINQVVMLSTMKKQRIHSCCNVLDKLLAIKQPIVTSHVINYK
ncbi:unnamed protein product [Medioppia subpectinata]|uniref:Uncharacterized protein n=1 Tax=Medioppia subpectinata TaxID=1979941 RepID=A0A7R9PZJ5_9ACAR|nr:unnamed protein product [Medioppia subpectinata]CAG2106246.1 unnamed protein product [Medioppia subpectinata]